MDGGRPGVGAADHMGGMGGRGENSGQVSGSMLGAFHMDSVREGVIIRLE